MEKILKVCGDFEVHDFTNSVCDDCGYECNHENAGCCECKVCGKTFIECSLKQECM